ncbi:MAG: HAD-IIIC family phosphatase [Mucispirillum sp.]|nr:HAD-IIIC family phosphatase [Mucispirillum sp.]
MSDFRTLQKNSRKECDGAKVSVCVMGDVATQFLAQAVKGYGYECNLNLNITDIDYNQIDMQTMDSASELYESKSDYVLIYMSAEKLYEKFCHTAISLRDKFAEMQVEYIKEVHNRINSNVNSKILQFNFIEINDGVFGSYGNKVPVSFIYQIKKLNYLLNEYAATAKNVFIIDLSSLAVKYGYDFILNEKYFYSAKMALSIEILPHAAKAVIDVIKAVSGSIKKCVILDLDNTLWGGVIGDDGLGGIQIGELGAGHAFSDFQAYFLELKKRGIVLAVCSKNNEDTAKEPFNSHPEMVLKLSDIAVFVANWEDKASNIKYIKETLNLGYDSFVFIDDNPFERNLVKSVLPDVTVPDMPEDPALYLSYIRSLNLFETASYSSEDISRTEQYQAEIGRKSLEASYSNIDDYLQSLEMQAEAKAFDEFHYSRIAQLTQRSNQFNLRTIRYTEADIEKISKDDNYLTIYFTLKDKFGDHGLISVAIMKKVDNETLFIDTWLMSCRVLKRGMEEFIVNKMIDIAKKNGYKTVQGEYIKTPKNAMVEKIYSKLGFHDNGDNSYTADVNAFINNKTLIKEI